MQTCCADTRQQLSSSRGSAAAAPAGSIAATWQPSCACKWACAGGRCAHHFAIHAGIVIQVDSGLSMVYEDNCLACAD